MIIRKKKGKGVPKNVLKNWCKYFNIPIKGIFARNEEKPLLHSSCIMKMDDFRSRALTGFVAGAQKEW